MPRKRHLCPECQEPTMEKFYCVPCRDRIKKPPFTPPMLRRNAHAIRAEMEWSTQIRRHETMEGMR